MKKWNETTKERIIKFYMEYITHFIAYFCVQMDDSKKGFNNHEWTFLKNEVSSFINSANTVQV